MSVVIWLLWWSFHSRTQASSSAKAERCAHQLCGVCVNRAVPVPFGSVLAAEIGQRPPETTAALRPEKTTVAAVGSGALVVQHNVSQSVTSPMHPFQTTHNENFDTNATSYFLYCSTEKAIEMVKNEYNVNKMVKEEKKKIISNWYGR
ncbi:Alpha terpineol synthase,chloroplastic [Trichinella pseudospiralis]